MLSVAATAFLTGLLVGALVVRWWYAPLLRRETKLADAWRETAVGNAGNLDELLAAQAQARGHRRQGGTVDEMRRLLDDLPAEARPVRMRNVAEVQRRMAGGGR